MSEDLKMFLKTLSVPELLVMQHNLRATSPEDQEYLNDVLAAIKQRGERLKETQP